MHKTILISVLLALSVFYSFAQTPTVSPKTISGGVLNGKATSLPKPIYPPEARAEKASGTVSVQVLIDESGTIVLANAVSGHPLLRAASEAAAREARFSPTFLSGQPTKVSGVITYNFVPDRSNEQKLELVAKGMFLYMVRGSVHDLEKLNLATGSSDLIGEMVKEFPEITESSSDLLALKNTPPEKRLAVIDSVILAVNSKLSAKEQWQFELGKNLGDLFAQFLNATDEEGFSSAKLSDSSIRSVLSTVKAMAAAAPADFPTDVLAKLKDLGEVSTLKSLTTMESSEMVIEKVLQLIGVISPDTEK